MIVYIFMQTSLNSLIIYVQKYSCVHIKHSL